MNIKNIDTLLTIDERTLLQLLNGKGRVRIRIDNFGKYYVPYVLTADSEEGEIVPRGVIVRNHCMFAAKTKDGVRSVIKDIADGENLGRIDAID